MTLNMAVDISYEEFEKLFNKKFSHYEERIQREIEQGMTLEKLNYKKPKKTPEEKKAIQKQKTEQIRKRRRKQKALKEQEAINRFTTAEIKVDMSGMSNTVHNTNDLDGIVDGLTTRVLEAMEIVRDGA